MRLVPTFQSPDRMPNGLQWTDAGLYVIDQSSDNVYVMDVTGRVARTIATPTENGSGITGFATPIKTAYWNHTPMLLVTPQAANKTLGQGGFQEVEQMALFKDMVCYQEEVRDATRIPEVLNRVIEKAIRGSAPAQINVPRDFWTQVIDVELPPIVRLERPAGGAAAIAAAA